MENQFTEHLKKINGYNEAISLLYWDFRTGAPKKGADLRSETIGILSTEVFHLSTSNEFGELISSLESKKQELDSVMRRSVEEARKDYDLSKKIPPEEYKNYVVLQAKAESVWEDAKAASDFSMFQPYLEDLVASTKKMIGYWGEKNGSPYNTLLDQYEPGMTTEVLDDVFGKLRDRIVPLVKKIQNSPAKPDTEFLFKQFPKDAQREFSNKILEQLGYDFEAGRLDETNNFIYTKINSKKITLAA